MKPFVFVSENIALGKPATQLGTYRDYDAGLAVDGDMRQYRLEGSCAHPHSEDMMLPDDVRLIPAWWQVDLSDGDPTRTYVIRNVTIYFRWENSGELDCMKVLFSIKNTPDVLDGLNYYCSLFFKLLY